MNESLDLHALPQATLLAYSTPSLRLVGDLRELTASGSGMVSENPASGGMCSGQIDRSMC